MPDRIRALIERTLGWQEEHIRAGRQIEAAACSIRLRALRDCLKIAETRHGEG